MKLTRFFRPAFVFSHRGTWLAVVLGLTGGCAAPHVERQALSAENNAAALSARTLHDEGLGRFLAQNTGHEPAEWDFETLSWVAFYYHPSLEVARAQWATMRAVQQTAAARPNPAISLTPGYDTTHQAGVSPWFPAVNFDFLLQTSGKRAHRQDIARADAEAARLAVLSAAWRVRSDLRRALTDATTARRRESLLRAQAEEQRKLLALLEQRVAAGNATAADVSTARSAFLRAEAAAADVLGQSAGARARVAAALGLPLAALDGVTLSAPSAAIPLSADTLAVARRQSLQSRADVLAALAKFQSAQAALELEAAKQQPDIHLGPGYQWDQGQNKWSLALTFELPLFHRNETMIAEATARRAEAAAQFNAVQAQSVAAIDAATAAQTAATMQLDHAHRLHAEMEKQNAFAQQRLDLGAADQVELQSARLDLAIADTVLLAAETAAALAAGQLEEALQVPFPNLAALADTTRANSSRTP